MGSSDRSPAFCRIKDFRATEVAGELISSDPGAVGHDPHSVQARAEDKIEAMYDWEWVPAAAEASPDFKLVMLGDDLSGLPHKLGKPLDLEIIAAGRNTDVTFQARAGHFNYVLVAVGGGKVVGYSPPILVSADSSDTRIYSPHSWLGEPPPDERTLFEKGVGRSFQEKIKIGKVTFEFFELEFSAEATFEVGGEVKVTTTLTDLQLVKAILVAWWKNKTASLAGELTYKKPDDAKGWTGEIGSTSSFSDQGFEGEISASRKYSDDEDGLEVELEVSIKAEVKMPMAQAITAPAKPPDPKDDGGDYAEYKVEKGEEEGKEEDDEEESGVTASATLTFTRSAQTGVSFGISKDLVVGAVEEADQAAKIEIEGEISLTIAFEIDVTPNWPAIFKELAKRLDDPMLVLSVIGVMACAVLGIELIAIGCFVAYLFDEASNLDLLLSEGAGGKTNLQSLVETDWSDMLSYFRKGLLGGFDEDASIQDWRKIRNGGTESLQLVCEAALRGYDARQQLYRDAQMQRQDKGQPSSGTAFDADFEKQLEAQAEVIVQHASLPLLRCAQQVRWIHFSGTYGPIIQRNYTESNDCWWKGWNAIYLGGSPDHLSDEVVISVPNGSGGSYTRSAKEFYHEHCDVSSGSRGT